MSASAADAAALVLAERARSRAAEATKKAEAAPAPARELVSVVEGWVGAEAGEVDGSELERRQRAISRRLAARQRQLDRDGKELERVRGDLAALEAPLKAEIMSMRTALEEANRRESALVDEVNGMREALHGKEADLAKVREEKTQHADSLVSVMADYEKRKTDALNSIASLVGEDPVEADVAAPKKAAGFLGF